MTELVPGILSQMGPESLAQLRKLAESFKAAQDAAAVKGEDAGDDEVPELVENFEEVAEAEKAEA